MVAHRKTYGWAQSSLSQDDTEFFKAIKRNSFNTASTSFTGNDIVYYKRTKVVPWVAGMITIAQYKKNLKKRKK